MKKLTVNLEKTVGKIKAMHAVGQPPFVGANFTYIKYLKDANIPYSRLHDVGGAFGGGCFVDIPNVFPNFDADENLPSSYDFEYTDRLISALIENNCEPIYRLGVTIENAILQGYKPRTIMPPADFGKWARICEMIIRHYNEGWADGFHHGIKYWEIWNEPENGIMDGTVKERNQMWWGTDEEYMRLYTVASKHLKSCFGDSIKVGGYASCGFYYAITSDPCWGTERVSRHRVEFLDDFLTYIKKESAHLDFFSWHSYGDVDITLKMYDYLYSKLEEYGYSNVETHINEWNNAASPSQRGTTYAAAQAAAMLCAMQDTKTHLMCYYDAKIGLSYYGGLFDPVKRVPYCTYYPFLAFGELYRLGNQVECLGQGDGIYATAAKCGSEAGVLISNSTSDEKQISTNLDSSFKVYLIDEEHYMTESELDPSSFALGAYGVAYLKKS